MNGEMLRWQFENPERAARRGLGLYEGALLMVEDGCGWGVATGAIQMECHEIVGNADGFSSGEALASCVSRPGQGQAA